MFHLVEALKFVSRLRVLSKSISGFVFLRLFARTEPLVEADAREDGGEKEDDDDVAFVDRKQC
jgi:hypothetical protein